MKFHNVIMGAAISIALFFSACDDSTSTLGIEVMPEGDFTESRQSNFLITNISSVRVDSILARSTTAYLGQFTDPYTGTTIRSDFLSQFYCPENFEFRDFEYMYKEDENGNPVDPGSEEGTPKAKAVELLLYFTDFFGDSIGLNKLQIYELSKESDKILDPAELYYTNLDAENYIASSTPLAEHSYTVIDQINGDSLYEANGVRLIDIMLPVDLGHQIIQSYYENPDYFANSSKFIQNVFAGIYVNNVQSAGTIVDIDYIYLNVYFDYYEERTTTGEQDSLVSYYAQFIATPEVIQQNRFQNDGIDEFLAASDDDVSYIQTPAGVFTTLELPIDEIKADIDSESGEVINAAMLTLKRVNTLNGYPFRMSTPDELLMVREADMVNFFETQQVPNDSTSFTSYFSDNEYSFSNITALINYLRNMDDEEKQEEADNGYTWNKVILIPVTEVTQTSSSSTSSVVRMLHDLSINFVKLKAEDVELRVVYSRYKDGQN